MVFDYIIESKFLTKEECDIILNFSLENLKLEPSVVIYNNKIEINDVRKSSQAFYPYYKEFPFLLNKINNLLNQHIKVKGFDLNYEHSEFQFTKYNTGGYFEWHSDIHKETTKNEDRRYCSLVIQLNDEYDGGNLQLKNSNDEVLTIEKNTGNLILFLSDIEHKVDTVKSGVRYTLVNWVNLVRSKNYKKTLL